MTALSYVLWFAFEEFTSAQHKCVFAASNVVDRCPDGNSGGMNLVFVRFGRQLPEVHHRPRHSVAIDLEVFSKVGHLLRFDAMIYLSLQ